MTDTARNLSHRYTTTLHRYLAAKEEAGLEQAYELGRAAIAGGMGILDMARIHQGAMVKLFLSPGAKITPQTTEAAETFFLEALSPFEAAHRGFREANLKLRLLNETLEHRNTELAESNRDLENEVAERMRTEKALRQSEENLRNLSRKILHVQEEERTRISRELHDEVGQALTAINVNLTMLKRNGSSRSAALKKKFSDTQTLLEQTMENVHRFARELRPAMLDDLGLLPALRSYTKAFTERTSIRIRFQASALAEKLDRERKTVVFRVAQESLNNVAKHAHATRVDLTIQKVKDGITMSVKDNGRSFSVERKTGKGNKRLGLLGMQERVRLVNGTFGIESAPGKGTTIRIDIPFQGPR
ncbi:MAG: histidine kinase [Verrucomicrobiota bacterium]